MDGQTVAWLGRQMMYRYNDNAKAQQAVSSMLNASIRSVMVLVTVSALYLVSRPII